MGSGGREVIVGWAGEEIGGWEEREEEVWGPERHGKETGRKGQGKGGQPAAVFDRVVFMVVDALRSDFVFGAGSGFGRALRLSTLAAANVLLVVGLGVFGRGFFPFKPVLSGLATFEGDGGDGGGWMGTGGERKEGMGVRGWEELGVGGKEVIGGRAGEEIGGWGEREEEVWGQEGTGKGTGRKGKGKGGQPVAVFDRVVFMVVDALRSDFVFGAGSGFGFVQNLIRAGAAIPFTAHATPPTVTMPRIKALTTGSVPSFADLIFNLDESGTGSSLATQDTWLAQIKARGGKLVFYGDDTWLRLFPEKDFFERAEGTSSFFVSDFTEVDNNVTRHLPSELERSDWEGMVLHFLGLDHIGHKTGPQGVNMLPKQREMDGVVKMIYEAMETSEHLANTLLVLAGDHGMNAGGNHGGSGPGETEPALVFASPKFRGMRRKKGRSYECPTLPKEGTEFHYYRKVQQSDLVPTLAGLMGLPISRNSLGVFVRELSGVWDGSRRGAAMLWRNAVQIRRIVEAAHGTQAFGAMVERWKVCLDKADENQDKDRCGEPTGADDALARYWALASSAVSGLDSDREADWDTVDEHILDFLLAAQGTLSSAASSYDIPRMVLGMLASAAALALAILSLPAVWPPSTAGIFFATTTLLYGVMMFASSYVEEEQHFWYWLAPAWTLLLTARSVSRTEEKGRKLRIAAAGVVILAVHRVAVRWNQTGQKHAGAPDIVHAFFPYYHVPMWILILWTYGRNCYTLAGRTFLGILPTEIAVAAAVALTVPAIVFKFNFTQADAPELVQGLAVLIRRWTEPFSLVLQAQVTFGLLALATVTTVVLAVGLARGTSIARKDGPAVNVTLAERLHYLLTMFLITQSRTPNIPLFLGLELQLLALSVLLDDEAPKSRRNASISTTELVTTVLLVSHVCFFCMGGSNSISSVDLSNAYNGIADYNVAAVGVLLFSSNWTGPFWWCSAAVSLTFSMPTKAGEGAKPVTSGKRAWIDDERDKLRRDAKAEQSSISDDLATQDHWLVYVSSMTVFVAASLLAVMAACTALRTHLFIWTVFSPKYLYAMAWCAGWHMLVNIGFGSLLRWLGEIA
ncbi:hypothetical protein B0A55_03877 [Friedmanniomyces simplex]|uniref:GPI ethanolamine phosphate transferase 2 n=1 Tax=Friedmanniomyces simplex TaxID=329884 RepID=A0A4V5NHD7_9PEZI|nr:hypothetical protein B0A55_03877 [Friedmanniomyces simplex]